jgi:hypothetical protein
MKHTVEPLRFPEATVEAITEFRQRWANRAMEYHLIIAQACVYGILLGFGIYNFFESS